MEFFLTVEDYPQPKPEPDPYLAGMKRFNAEPEDCIIIEDSRRGLRAAHAAGIDCIIVSNDFTQGQDFSEALEIIDSLEDLPELLNRL